MATEQQRPENLAETLSRVLPTPQTLAEIPAAGGGMARHFIVPMSMKVVEVDDAGLLAAPRRTKIVRHIDDEASFVEYVNRFTRAGFTKVWCKFDPQATSLSFRCVIDDHGADVPGWCEHVAEYKPAMSAEWKAWSGANGKEMSQVDFAEWIEAHEKDITGLEGSYPSSLQMMTMATAFEANAEKRFKTKVRLQSGGVALEYVNTDDEATVEQMKLFERFCIAIPVFWSTPRPDTRTPAWPIKARLKYNASQGAVKFRYQLDRPDIVHEAAAVGMIDRIREAIGFTPLLMGD